MAGHYRAVDNLEQCAYALNTATRQAKATKTMSIMIIPIYINPDAEGPGLSTHFRAVRIIATLAVVTLGVMAGFALQQAASMNNFPILYSDVPETVLSTLMVPITGFLGFFSALIAFTLSLTAAIMLLFGTAKTSLIFGILTIAASGAIVMMGNMVA